MKDSSETDQEQLLLEMSELQKQNHLLQQENKVLQLRATGVQVLGKVLQDSQEESDQLKQQVNQLKEKLKEIGVDEPQLSLQCNSESFVSHKSQTGNVSTSNPSSYLSSSWEYSSSPQSSDLYSSLVPDKQLQFSCQEGPVSMCLHTELHTKELRQKFNNLTNELGNMNHFTNDLMERMKTLDSEECKGELKVKLERLKNRIKTWEKETKTREALMSALVTQEEHLKAKWADVEAEQVSQENVVQKLFKDIKEDREELERIEDEILFLRDAVVVNKSQISKEMQSKSVILSPDDKCKSERAGTSTLTERNHSLQTSPPGHCGDEVLEKKIEQLQLQCSELQRLLEELRSERDEANRLKDEILDVNHLWDAQYRQLRAETSHEISDLKQKVELLSCDDSQQRFEKLWIKTKSMVDAEKKAKEQVEQEKQIYLEKSQNLEEELKRVQEQNKNLHLHLEQKEKHVSLLQENLSHFPSQSSQRMQVIPTDNESALPQQGTQSGDSPNSTGSLALHAPPEIVDQIEMLKAQLRVYVDDFLSERQDRERVQAEKQGLQEELEAVKEQVVALEAQVEQFQDDWKREKEEKERLQRQFRGIGSGGMTQGGLEYQSQAQLTQKAQAIAEQEAKLKAMRENHEFQERLLQQERQELEQQARAVAHGQQQYMNPAYGSFFAPGGRGASPVVASASGRAGYPPYIATGRQDYKSEQPQRLQPRQQYLYARGPIQAPSDQERPLDDMFRGGDVQPDSDLGYEVIDSPAVSKESGEDVQQEGDQNYKENQCPRCLRLFKEGENQSLFEHIEKCIP